MSWKERVFQRNETQRVSNLASVPWVQQASVLKLSVEKKNRKWKLYSSKPTLCFVFEKSSPLHWVSNFQWNKKKKLETEWKRYSKKPTLCFCFRKVVSFTLSLRLSVQKKNKNLKTLLFETDFVFLFSKSRSFTLSFCFLTTLEAWFSFSRKANRQLIVSLSTSSKEVCWAQRNTAQKQNWQVTWADDFVLSKFSIVQCDPKLNHAYHELRLIIE